MLATAAQSAIPSTFDPTSSTIGVTRQPRRPTSQTGTGTEKQALWIPMLQSASKGKDLIEKHLIVLGGSSEQQREFLDHLNPDNLRAANSNRQRRRQQGGNSGRTGETNVPLSNKYALGYTYHDILDADQEDVLARLNVHLLTNPSGRFVPLLRPLLSDGQTVKDTLVVVLLDWNDPFKWAQQLRQWIRLLRKVIVSLDEEVKIQLEECMNAWKEKRLGNESSLSSTTQQEQGVVNLGPGEWDEGLGIPLMVVCGQSEKIQDLERDVGWQDDQFDFLQQWLRTVLLKHGASLVYTGSYEANYVRTVVHSSLNVHSLLKKEVVKHNVVDRDKVLIPSNWDSWGKIRILREGFDPEAIADAWSVEIQDQPEDDPKFMPQKQDDVQAIIDASQQPASAVLIFESSLRNPAEQSTTSTYNKNVNSASSTAITVTVTPLQEFLQTQHTILEKYLAEDREAAHKSMTKPGFLNNPLATVDGNEKDSSDLIMSPSKAASATPRSRATSPAKAGPTGANPRMAEQIGPYQINVNGIDFDAEEATRRLRERENGRNAAAAAAAAGSGRRDLSSMNTSTATSSSTTTHGRPRPVNTASSYNAGGSGGGGVNTEGPSTPGADGKEKPSNEALHGFFANLIKKGQGSSSRGGSAGVGSGASSPAPRRESPAPGGGGGNNREDRKPS